MFNRILLRYIIRNRLKGVMIEDLLRVEGRDVFIGRTKLTHEEVLTLRDEAQIFENSLLWKLMSNNLYWIANFKMMRGANSEFEMTNGRMMTLVIDTLEEFISRLKSIE